MAETLREPVAALFLEKAISHAICAPSTSRSWKPGAPFIQLEQAASYPADSFHLFWE
ncbi:MAG: hypothetical protein IJJ80_08535 [Clostridia bacterium]|nr:hypothetical protein [Clostridia bacterium]